MQTDHGTAAYQANPTTKGHGQKVRKELMPFEGSAVISLIGGVRVSNLRRRALDGFRQCRKTRCSHDGKNAQNGPIWAHWTAALADHAIRLAGAVCERNTNYFGVPTLQGAPEQSPGVLTWV